MNIIEAFIIAVVEGITEFLPISSTGHMIITENMLGMGLTDADRNFVKLFTVSIQLGYPVSHFHSTTNEWPTLHPLRLPALTMRQTPPYRERLLPAGACKGHFC